MEEKELNIEQRAEELFEKIKVIIQNYSALEVMHVFSVCLGNILAQSGGNLEQNLESLVSNIKEFHDMTKQLLDLQSEKNK